MKASRSEILKLLEVLEVAEALDFELNSSTGIPEYYGFKYEDEDVIDTTISGLSFIRKSLLKKLEVLEKEMMENWLSNHKGV